MEDHHHMDHDDRVSSIAFREDKPLDLEKVDQWMSYLVQKKGAKIDHVIKGFFILKGWRKTSSISGASYAIFRISGSKVERERNKTK